MALSINNVILKYIRIMNTNVLKKIQIGNPLINLGLMKLYYEYEALQTEEDLIEFYYRLLNATEGSEVATSVAYMMISFSIGMDVNPLIQLAYATD